MKYPKNLFLITSDEMHPYISRGDIAIFEPMRLGYRMINGVYIVEYKKKRMIARVQLLVFGGMRLLFDSDTTGKMIEFSKEEREQVVFVGHVTGRIFRDVGLVKGYSLYS